MGAEDDFDISHIKGNASDEIKRAVGNPAAFYGVYQSVALKRVPVKIQAFGDPIWEGLQVTEISLYTKPEEEKKMEAKVVTEITVKEDMLNGGGNVHGGCIAFLIDMCSTLALFALNMHSTDEIIASVSQALNIIFHSPAVMGDKLRLVNTTLTLGSRAHSARTEIWSATHHRLVASGTHIKMQASAPPKSLL